MEEKLFPFKDPEGKETQHSEFLNNVSKRKNNKYLLFSIVLLIILILGYFIIDKLKLKTSQKNEIKITDKAEQNDQGTDSIKDISDWKTYKSNDYGFEFQYPPGWNMVNREPSTSERMDYNLSVSVENGREFIKDEYKQIVNCNGYSGVEINRIAIETSSFSQEIKEIVDAYNETYGVSNQAVPITLQGRKAFKIPFESNHSCLRDYWYAVQMDDETYLSIALAGNEQAVDEIFSSIKFTSK